MKLVSNGYFDGEDVWAWGELPVRRELSKFAGSYVFETLSDMVEPHTLGICGVVGVMTSETDPANRLR